MLTARLKFQRQEETRMSEIAVVALFVAKPGCEDKLHAALQALVEPTLKEEGALQYALHRDIREPRRFVFIERWTSEEALAAHGQSAHIQAHRKSTPELLEQDAAVHVLKAL
jgi:quinol monooxygenase YgiN